MQLPSPTKTLREQTVALRRKCHAYYYMNEHRTKDLHKIVAGPKQDNQQLLNEYCMGIVFKNRELKDTRSQRDKVQSDLQSRYEQ